MSGQPDRSNVADSTQAVFDPYKVREDFPILEQRVNGKRLVYLDNAATSQKPRSVIEATSRYYRENNANVHRGLHTLSERATRDYEGARDAAVGFLNARSRKETVFVRGTTEAINVVAQGYARPRLRADDEVIISHMEHHSNIVPWQLVCEQTGAKLRVIPINDNGELEFDAYLKLLGPRTRFVSVVHLSNSLGTINPVEDIIEAAHGCGVPVLIDGAQAAQHSRIDVQALDCDFYALSGHKIYGPTGIGLLYGKQALLEDMAPCQGGGDMIKSVTFERTLYNDLPYKFEAGTPNIAGAVGLSAAIGYLAAHSMAAVAEHERAVLEYGSAALADIPGLRLIGTARNKAAILGFVMDGIHAHDIGTVLDAEGVAIRAGHHCTMPVMQRYGVAATARASLGLYSTREDIDALAAGLLKARELFDR